MTIFEAYITNLGKYAEGQLVGETLKFPATTEEVQSLLKNIGVDGVRYEEFFITAFDGDVMGLYDYLTEYENLDELNHLAHLISELDSDEIETLEAALNKGDHTSSVADIINLVHNLDCYSLHPGVTDDETLGRIYVEDMELLDVPDILLRDPLTASYFVAVWKMLRKKGCVPSALTQNVKDLLASREIENILDNTDFKVLLSQAQSDRAILAKQLGISEHQLSYITHSNSGEGLLFYGNVTIPFVDRFPRGEIYDLLTTRPEDLAHERTDE